jgi:hypothetical protein
MPSSPPRTMGSRAESYCSSTPIPIVGSGLCHAATMIVSSSRLPLKNQRMIGILLNLLSFVRVSASAGPQYCDSDAGSYADSADELHPDAAAGLYSESADCDSTRDLYADSSSKFSPLRNRAHNYRIFVFAHSPLEG